MVGFCFLGVVVMGIDGDIGAAIGYFIIAVTLLCVFLYLERCKKAENISPPVPRPAPKAPKDTSNTKKNVSDVVQSSVENAPAVEEVADTNETETVNFRVAGISYKEDALMEIAWENPEYELSKREIFDEGLDGERIWRYEFRPKNVQLVEEPENPHDPNAIKVIVDGQHIGYIKAGSTTRVRNLLRSGKIEKITADIVGGPYKYAYTEEEINDNYETVEKRYIEKDDIPYSCKLQVKIRK